MKFVKERGSRIEFQEEIRLPLGFGKAISARPNNIINDSLQTMSGKMILILCVRCLFLTRRDISKSSN